MATGQGSGALGKLAAAPGTRFQSILHWLKASLMRITQAASLVNLSPINPSLIAWT